MKKSNIILINDKKLLLYQKELLDTILYNHFPHQYLMTAKLTLVKTLPNNILAQVHLDTPQIFHIEHSLHHLETDPIGDNMDTLRVSI